MGRPTTDSNGFDVNTVRADRPTRNSALPTIASRKSPRITINHNEQRRLEPTGSHKRARASSSTVATAAALGTRHKTTVSRLVHTERTTVKGFSDPIKRKSRKTRTDLLRAARSEEVATPLGYSSSRQARTSSPDAQYDKSIDSGFEVHRPRISTQLPSNNDRQHLNRSCRSRSDLPNSVEKAFFSGSSSDDSFSDFSRGDCSVSSEDRSGDAPDIVFDDSSVRAWARAQFGDNSSTSAGSVASGAGDNSNTPASTPGGPAAAWPAGAPTYEMVDSARDDGSRVTPRKAERKVRCLVCGDIISNLSNFRMHLMSRHQGVLEPSFVECRGCNKFFDGDSGLLRHQRKHKAVDDPCGRGGFSPSPLGFPAAQVRGPVAVAAEAQDSAPQGVLYADNNSGDVSVIDLDLLLAFPDKCSSIQDAWGDDFTELSISLIGALGGGYADTVEGQAEYTQGTLAMLILPGLMMVIHKDRSLRRGREKLTVADFLKTCTSLPAANPREYILSTARDLYPRQKARLAAEADRRSQRHHVSQHSLERTAQKLAKDGRPSRCHQTLEQLTALRRAENGDAGRTDDSVNRMLTIDQKRDIIRALNPSRRPDSGWDELPATPITDEPAGQTVTEEQALHGLITMSRGKACGADGWSDHLLRFLAVHASKMSPNTSTKLGKALASWLNDCVFGGRMPAAARDLWTLTRSALLGKPDGGHRPLGLRSVWYRYTGRLGNSLTCEAVGKQVGPIQLAVGFADGCVVGARSVQAFWDTPPSTTELLDSRAILSIDIKNAFNTLSRVKIYEALCVLCPQLVRFFRLFYGDDATLVDASGDLLGTSEIGIVQGDPLSGLFCACALNGVLRELQDAIRETEEQRRGAEAVQAGIVAYADDANGMASLGTILQVASLVPPLLAREGLTGNVNKFVIAGPRVDELPADLRPAAFWERA